MPYALRLASCHPLPEDDVDLELLHEQFHQAGVETVILPWHEETLWQVPRPTLIRSTWNYISRLDEYRGWLARRAAEAPLWNSLNVIQGNLHKRYLLELAQRGVPTVPTVLQLRGSEFDLAVLAERVGWQQVVIKPAIGAASFETHRLLAEDPAARRLFGELLACQDMLVQPYLPSVEGYGERAMVWIDGEFTHAVRKTPRFSGGVEQVSEALAITPEERAVGEQALALVAQDALYARVDVAPGVDGAPVVMEVELVEPSLFLRQSPAALQRLVAGVLRRLH